jgi:hypothetical protein
MGTPSRTHNAVATVEVRRLSASASNEAGDLMSSKNLAHGVRATMAIRGSITNAAPTMAGT